MSFRRVWKGTYAQGLNSDESGRSYTWARICPIRSLCGPRDRESVRASQQCGGLCQPARQARASRGARKQRAAPAPGVPRVAAVDVSGRVDELASYTGVAIGPYRKSRLRRLTRVQTSTRLIDQSHSADISRQPAPVSVLLLGQALARAI
jgi:hypothetical protein